MTALSAPRQLARFLGIVSIPLQAFRSKSTIAGNSNVLHSFHVDYPTISRRNPQFSLDFLPFKFYPLSPTKR
jgi:hypothetical protein